MVKRHISVRSPAGLLVGSVGLYLESFWISAVYHYPWPTGMWPGKPLRWPCRYPCSWACAVHFAMVITGERLPQTSRRSHRGTVTVLAIGGAVANGLRVQVPEMLPSISLTELPSDPGQRMVSLDARFSPQNLIGDDPEWVSILSWQERSGARAAA